MSIQDKILFCKVVPSFVKVIAYLRSYVKMSTCSVIVITDIYLHAGLYRDIIMSVRDSQYKQISKVHPSASL